MKKWQLVKTSLDEKTKLWFNNSLKQYSIWRNKGSIIEFTNDTTLEKAEEEFDMFVNMIENDDMTLENWLLFNNLKLTELEVSVLNCIRSQGSFYEEAAFYNDITKQYYVSGRSCFFGWYIDEDELPGCRGAISSLVKKGILDVVYQDVNGEDVASYYIRFTPEFDEHDNLSLSKGVLVND